MYTPNAEWNFESIGLPNTYLLIKEVTLILLIRL